VVDGELFVLRKILGVDLPKSDAFMLGLGLFHIEDLVLLKDGPVLYDCHNFLPAFLAWNSRVWAPALRSILTFGLLVLSLLAFLLQDFVNASENGLNVIGEVNLGDGDEGLAGMLEDPVLELEVLDLFESLEGPEHPDF